MAVEKDRTIEDTTAAIALESDEVAMWPNGMEFLTPFEATEKLSRRSNNQLMTQSICVKRRLDDDFFDRLVGKKERFVNNSGRKYTDQLNQRALKIAANGIDIVRDDNKKTPSFEEAHGLIKKAKTVCFFGFGFDDANFDRLKLAEHLSGDTIFATAIGLPPAKLQAVQKSLKLIHPPTVVEIKTVRDLMGAHTVFGL